MPSYDWIQLKPFSLQVLSFLSGKQPMKSDDIAKHLDGVTARQVDAAVTKSLVRHGLVQRTYHLTRLQKREYAVIGITEKGENYLRWIASKGGE